MKLSKLKKRSMLMIFAMKVNNIVSNIRELGDTVEYTYILKKILRVVHGKFVQIDHRFDHRTIPRQTR